MLSNRNLRLYLVVSPVVVFVLTTVTTWVRFWLKSKIWPVNHPALKAVIKSTKTGSWIWRRCVFIVEKRDPTTSFCVCLSFVNAVWLGGATDFPSVLYTLTVGRRLWRVTGRTLNKQGRSIFPSLAQVKKWVDVIIYHLISRVHLFFRDMSINSCYCIYQYTTDIYWLG